MKFSSTLTEAEKLV